MTSRSTPDLQTLSMDERSMLDYLMAWSFLPSREGKTLAAASGSEKTPVDRARQCRGERVESYSRRSLATRHRSSRHPPEWETQDDTAMNADSASAEKT